MKPPVFTKKIEFHRQLLTLDPRGAIYWSSENLLIVSDLHFGKGSFFAKQGSLLPPYDLIASIMRVKELKDFYKPSILVCLGDSWHDKNAGERISPKELDILNNMVRDTKAWLWILGNHDPEIPESVEGDSLPTFELEGIEMLHYPEKLPLKSPTICGHFHPKAKIDLTGYKISGKTFVKTENLMIMPSMGDYTGGLDISRPEMRKIIGPGKFNFFFCHKNKIYQYERNN